MVRSCWRGDPRERRGLTLREALVVVFVVGLLWVLVLKYMGSVVGPVRLNGCANNLSSLGKAIAVTQQANGGQWPAASTEPLDAIPANTQPIMNPAQRRRRRDGGDRVARKVAGYSWIVSQLQNLDERSVATGIRTKSDQYLRSSFDPKLVDDEGRHFSQTVLKVLQCPVSGTTGSQAPEYREMALKLADKNARDLPVAVTNFVAISATHLALVLPEDNRPAKPNGVIVYSPRQKGVVKIADGDTNTLVLTETCEPNYAAWFDGTTTWVVAHDPNSTEPVQRDGRWVCDEDRGCRSSLTTSMEALAEDDESKFYRRDWAGKEAWRYGPSSLHGGGIVNHLYGDKRVAVIRATGPNRIAPSVYFALVTRDGGEPDRPPE